MIDIISVNDDQVARIPSLPDSNSRFVGCAVVPGLSPGSAWTEALAKAAEQASLSISFPEWGEPLRGDGVVVVSQPGSALPYGVTDWAVLPLDFVLDQSTVNLSQLFAQAYDGLPRDATLIRGDPAVSRFSLFGRLDVEVPSLALGAGDSIAGHAFLAPYSEGPPTHGVGTTMPLEMFKLDDRHDRSGYPVGDLDITGRARYLLHGSYHWLPRGLWRVTVTLAVDADAGAHAYRVEWGELSSFSQHSFRPNRAGRYSLTIDYRFEVASATELRIVLAQGSLGGRLIIENISLELVAH